MGDETIQFDEESGYPIIDEGLCTGCGICANKCPFGAIRIINLPEAVGQPAHQYGVNGFRLFGLPTPKKGVVGLIGQNATGKTTLLKILSGTMIPNLGKPKLEYWGPVLENYKHTELGTYLQDLSEGKVKLSMKPQEVDMIPKVFNGTVQQLLNKYDENNKADKLVQELELEHCLDTPVDKISGGELQRAAIITTLSRDADFYFFDEPSSFLDVKQRMKMARILREELEDKYVFVVEHDLAVLDYLTDYVHIVYGVPGAYGIVSNLKHSRAGINEFLTGYLKNENVRIRDYEIKFEPKPPSSEWKNRKKVEYPELVKTFPGFTLEAKQGDVIKGEVISILGPNAIGKTTFVKMLAGKEKPDKGEVKLDEEVSYKPQYITTDYTGTVQDWIQSQDLDLEFFNSELKPIIQDLYPKNMTELSGGEKQRVMTSAALARKAGICLLDEPSAYLDIEQRVLIAQKIKRATEKREITTLVVDHDMVFQDSVGNRILVFTGTPGRKGKAGNPEPMEDGMNKFLGGMQITFRRDPETGRPRVNKEGSQLDKQQKKSGKYYYTA